MAIQAMQRQTRPLLLYAAVAGVGSALLGGMAWAALEAPTHKVSQKGRMFLPGHLVVHRGETVQLVNDDVDLQHHAYVESDAFNFDSKEMAPGSRVNVIFPASGTYNVLCGIHPKMKLTVRVD